MGADLSALAAIEVDQLIRFDEPNLFFGGVNLACRDAEGRLSGGVDGRRGAIASSFLRWMNDI